MITVEVVVYSHLKKHIKHLGLQTNELFLSLPVGSSIIDVLKELWIPETEVHTVVVNGIYKDKDEVLCNGDRIGLLPAIAGG